MRRWFTLLLLVLMPLQSVWAAASAYCLHEEGRAATHLGHHVHQHRVHQHHADAATADGHQQDQRQGGLQDYDSDCGSCHLGGVLLLMPAAGLPAFDAARAAAAPAAAGYATGDPSPIERPNWSSAL